MSLLVQGDRIISHMDKELRNAEVTISDSDESNRTGFMMRVATKLSSSDNRDEIMQRAGVANTAPQSGTAGAKRRPSIPSAKGQSAPTSKVTEADLNNPHLRQPKLEPDSQVSSSIPRNLHISNVTIYHAPTLHPR